jgi:photosystem II stability/assembly factor-like uncharacterized protein
LFLTALLFGVPFATPTTTAADLSSTYTWKPIEIGGGGFVTGLVVHPTEPGLVYARTDVGGVYRWDEATKRWAQLLYADRVPTVLDTDYEVESVAVSKSNPNVVFIASGADSASATSGAGRILKSTDRGQTWTDSGKRWLISGNAKHRVAGERLAVDPNNEQVVYFGSRAEGLWVSTDGGATWSQVPTTQIPIDPNEEKASLAGVYWVIFDPSAGTVGGKTARIYAGVAGTNAGVYRSNDAGASWTRVHTNADANDMPYDVSITSSGTLYFTAINKTNYSNGRLLKYDPASGSITNITPPGRKANHFAIDPNNEQFILAHPGQINDGSIVRSTDGGATWSNGLNSALASDLSWILREDVESWMSSGRLVFDPHTPGRLWFAEGMGVWRTSDLNDDEITWNFVSAGIEEFVGTDVIGPAGRAITAVADKQGFLHIDPNVSPARTLIDEQFYGGFSLDYSGGNPNFLVYADVKNNYFPSLHGRGAFSTDGGQNWLLFKATPPNNIGGDITVSATDVNNLVWLPSTGDIKQGKTPYYSVDRGQVWRASKGVTSTKTHGLFWWHEKRALAADMVSAGTFYLLTYDNDGEFYVSTDGGANFAKAANSPRCNEADDCHVWGELRAAPGKAGHLWSTANRGGLYYTTDAGATPWVKVPQVQQARKIGFGKAAPGASYPTIFLHGKINDVDGLWRSTDQGQTWDLLAEHPGGLYAGISAVSGDMAIFGRVYVAIGGVSFVYGDIAGSNPTPPPLPTPDPNPTLPPPTQPPTPVPGQGNITVYDDDNGDGWYRFNWGSTVTETTTTVYTGTKALSIEYVGGWGALAFGRFKAPYSTIGYNAISFRAHGGSTASTRKFQVYTNPGGEGFPNSKAAVVDVSLPANA